MATDDQPEPAPVRVGRFEWERLMMVSPLPWKTRSILLALGVFMSAEGRGARPGLDGMVRLTRGRTAVIDHLAAAVAARYLLIVERGGYRQGKARATKYDAVVPADVYARRAEILASPPWRRADDDIPTSGGPDIHPPSAGGEGTTGRTLSRDERPAGRTLVEDEGPVSQDQGPVLGTRRSGGPDPITQLHHAENITQQAAAERIILDRTDATPAEAAALVQIWTRERNLRTPAAFLRGVPTHEIRDRLDQVRADTDRAARRAFLASIADEPRCEHEIPGGHIPEPGTGWVACPARRRLHQQRTA